MKEYRVKLTLEDQRVLYAAPKNEPISANSAEEAVDFVKINLRRKVTRGADDIYQSYLKTCKRHNISKVLPKNEILLLALLEINSSDAEVTNLETGKVERF